MPAAEVEVSADWGRYTLRLGALGPGPAVPLTVVAQVVPEFPAGCLRLGEEVEIAAAEGDEFLRRRRLPAYHQQVARDVINAVAVLVQWYHAVGMPDQADVVGQPLQVAERRVGVPHTAEAAALVPCAEPAPTQDMEEGGDAGLIRGSRAERFGGNLNAHQRLARTASRALRRPEQWLSVFHGLTWPTQKLA